MRHDLEDFGKHSLEVSSFMADTTFLSDSVLRQRGNTSKEDGGPSNTQRFNSYAISRGSIFILSLIILLRDYRIADRSRGTSGSGEKSEG